MAPLQMYGFWRSQATYRLRVALNLKGIAYAETPINLDLGEQFSPDFRRINPLGGVPALMIEEDSGKQQPLTQSMAILEYLEETYPDRHPLLPNEPLARANVRSLAAIAVADSHPLIVPRVRNYLKEHAGFSPSQWKEWQTHWFTSALHGFEARLTAAKHDGRSFCVGEKPTMADICLVGLVQGTRAFEIEVRNIPTVEGIVERCEKLEAFEKAKAKYQSDFPSQIEC